MVAQNISKIKSFDPSTAAKNPIPYDPKRIRSGPGALGEFMAQESKVFAENTQLKAELENIKNHDLVILIDPKKIKPSRLANRLPINFLTHEFNQLKQDIEITQGNIQPIKVRPIEGSKDEFEIVYGHRRHQACLELGLQVSAIVVKELTERQQFCEMEMENQSRLDISAYEKGLMFKKVIQLGIYKNASEIVKDIGCSNATISKLIALANFPPEIIDAFNSPHEISVRGIERLNRALIINKDLVIIEAKKIKNEIVKPSPSQVFSRLTAVASKSKRDLNEKQISVKWKLLKENRSAKIVIDNLPKDDEKRQFILDEIDNLLKKIVNDQN